MQLGLLAYTYSLPKILNTPFFYIGRMPYLHVKLAITAKNSSDQQQLPEPNNTRHLTHSTINL